MTTSRIPVIVGPTAGGKSDIAMALAASLGGEIVAADAYQVYQDLDIGTAKPTAADRARTPHHLIDVADPREKFSAAAWLTLAREAIAAVESRGRTPIVVGGTHLYVKLLLDGLFEGPGADEALRASLQVMENSALRAELERVDPVAAARLHPNDRRRAIRAIEVFRLTGKPISEHQRQWDMTGADISPSRFMLVGLLWPSELINPRINARVRQMIEVGLVQEARTLWEAGRLGPGAREALGYKQLIEHMEGKSTLEDSIEVIKIETRRFAKNQRTWLRRLGPTPGSIWIDAGAIDAQIMTQSCLARILEALENPSKKET